MRNDGSHVLVVGAGIGGLATALCLHETGHRVTVLDQVREPAPLGVGINVQPDAVAVLQGLGLGAWLAAEGVDVARHVYVDPSGRHRFTEARGRDGGYAGPQYAVHRGRLQTALLAAVRERCGTAAVRTGMRLLGVAQDERAVTVEVLDRRGGAPLTLHAGVLVGADGLHSAVRAALHPDDGPLLHSGTTMWRGLAAIEPPLDGRSMLHVLGDDGTRLVAYPIRRGDRTVVNWVAQILAGRTGPVVAGDVGWNRPGDPADVLARVRGWDLGVLDVAGMVEATAEILEFPMVDRDPLPGWGAGRVTLLGDAAHPMYPVGANGGTQAILDARALADALAADPDPRRALARYEEDRRPPTTAIVAANREMDADERAVRERADPADADAEAAAIVERYRAVVTGPATGPGPRA